MFLAGTVAFTLTALVVWVCWNHVPCWWKEPCIRLEFRLAEEEMAPGFLRMTADSGEDLFLRPEPIVKSSDIERAWADKDAFSGEAVVRVEFTESGGNRMGGVTANNIGKKITIALDGRIVAVHEIRVPLYRAVQFTAGFTTTEAERIASSICRREDGN